jgi:hypothetical protein
VAAQAATGAIRYGITFDPVKARWYLDASWKRAVVQPPAGDDLRGHRVLAVDVNAGHLAAIVVDSAGNPVGRPITSLLVLSRLNASTRDGHLREAISGLIKTAEHHACRAIVIENLDFTDGRWVVSRPNAARLEVSGAGPLDGWTLVSPRPSSLGV